MMNKQQNFSSIFHDFNGTAQNVKYKFASWKCWKETLVCFVISRPSARFFLRPIAVAQHHYNGGNYLLFSKKYIRLRPIASSMLAPPATADAAGPWTRHKKKNKTKFFHSGIFSKNRNLKQNMAEKRITHLRFYVQQKKSSWQQVGLFYCSRPSSTSTSIVIQAEQDGDAAQFVQSTKTHQFCWSFSYIQQVEFL